MSQTFLTRQGRKAAAAKPKRVKAMQRVEAWLARAGWSLFGALNVDRASALGGAILARLGPRLPKHRHVVGNLAVAFPDLDDAERERLARDVWRSVGRVVAEYPHLERLTDERVEIDDRYDLEAARGGRPAIFFSAHLGNWELAAATSKVARYPLDVVYSPQTNPFVHETLQSLRSAMSEAGAKVGYVERRQAVRGIIRAIQAGRSVGVLIDQRYDAGKGVPFFGLPAPAGTAPAALALKLKVDFVPVRVQRLEGSRFKATFFEALRPDPRLPDDEARALDLTARAYALFEAWIRDDPGQWLCLKRRWPREAMAKASAGRASA